MYSPARGNLPKEEQRRQIKEQKRNQLSLLLINKFRNKFNINSIAEQEIDRMMLNDIQSLLNSGAPTEQSLIHLDRTLESKIKDIRALQKTTGKVESSHKGMQQTGASLGQIDVGDAQSRRSMQSGPRSMRGSNGFGKQEVTGKTSYVVYEDPAAQLNVSEEKWNQIVQENLRKFKEDREKARTDKLAKTKVIQEAQKIQIAEKANADKVIRQKEIDFFNSHGVKSSDVYYVNADKQADRIASLRGGAKDQAVNLYNKHHVMKLNTREKMMKDTEDRMLGLQQLAEAEAKQKMVIKEKKEKLKGVIEQDTHEKNKFKHHVNVLSKSNDFGDDSVLSYLYKKKEHKSYQMAEKKEHMISLMQGRFQSQNKLADHEAKTLERDILNINQKYDQAQQNKKMTRKQLEMEAKQFQDKQVAEKEQIKAMAKQQRFQDHSKVDKDAEEYKMMEEQKKKERIMKNKNHLDSVMKQMDLKPKTFAKTGVAIMGGDAIASMPIENMEKLVR